MENQDNYLEINRRLWDAKTAYHLNSEFYDVKTFLDGRNSLTEIELALLGDISGRSVLHLQCHFGQDTISLSRMGASATGVDFSSKAIETARQLAQESGSTAQFICSDIYDLPNQMDKKFDLVFTSFGVIGWLPDLKKWAEVIAHFLKPGGKFIFAEFHPVAWMFDNNFSSIQYNYFNVEAIREEAVGTYADRDAPIRNESITWNHSLSETLNALIESGLEIKHFEEFDFSPFNCFNEMILSDDQKFRIRQLDNKIPLTFALTAVKKIRN
ncbi:MAG: methyltransferase domain-containing protein [Saprospiraceae bacterium]|jgi:SAM-dependent methyltransferase|nr:methyltransferase domain-containing protein [Candidatus Parvibacillus calidus]MBX2935553.1 methyltransferase domain-containing protein [Saprospiraceae bacterium]MBX7179922.1 methyltransferase domain-containing protein [Saprospiraceae bacterium]MCB0591834.1 methyltransferase domain-containing protein [Saprospiraceae bacterium]MCO5284737.1 methyltransferase domain-containing protein [Saprospiraceae bacterium]